MKMHNDPGKRDNGFTGQKKTQHSCESCHHRKVRCDVDSSGIPCNNCRLDARPCALRAPLKRGRKSRLERLARLARESAPFSGTDGPPGTTSGARPRKTTCNDGRAASSLPRRLPPSSDPHEDDAPAATDVYVPFYFHKFLQVGDMQHLSPRQIRDLELEHCLQVPSGPVLDEFIRQYFLYVHPSLPLLNEQYFWTLYTNSGRDRKDGHTFSLVLFQAMLFAASRFVSIALIKSCGFEDLESARTAFHRRAELLLTNSLESDSIVLAQTSLLLSLQATLVDQSLNSMWLSKAISYAKDAGAHNYYRAARPNVGCMLEKKRLWWCCILRDRMIAIGVRRNIQIGPGDFDFDQAGLTESDLAEEGQCLQLYDAESKGFLVKIAVAQCALAVAMTWTMTAAYRTSEVSPESPPTVSQLVSSIAETERAHTELKVWARRFMPELTGHDSRGQRHRTRNYSVMLFADMTLIHYHSTQIALYNHQALVLHRHQAQLDDHESRLASLSKALREAIANVADKIRILSDQGLAHNLPITAPSCSALPFVLEALNLRLSSPVQKDVHQRRLDCYANIMRLFRDQHDHTECVTTAINHLLQVADSEILHLITPQNPLRSFGHGGGGGGSGNTKALLPASSWTDIFTRNPKIYLRLSLFLDFALSRGRAPRAVDLQSWVLDTTTMSMPGSIRSLSLHVMSPSMLPATMPVTGRIGVVEVDADAEEDGLPMLATEQLTNFDFELSWPLNDVLDSTYDSLQLTDSLGPWFDIG